VGLIDVAKVVDGLSQTVAVSERLRGTGNLMAPGEVARDYFRTSTTGVFTSLDSLVTCMIYGRPTNQNVYTYSGSRWFWTGKVRTLYNHTQPPNGRVPDCIHGSVTTSAAMSTARSFHPGTVNVLLSDGSVRSVKSSIDQQLWKAVGTRNGSELFDSTF
jgi:prepilin-type processing-associated H-X9-DG protein